MKYKNLNYIISPRLGSFCGYVKLPKGHSFEKLFKLGIGYDKMDIDCHGGLTFSREVEKSDNCSQGFTEGYWIGWDYLHYGDYTNCGLGLVDKGKKWTEKEIEKECKNVIRQILKIK